MRRWTPRNGAPLAKVAAKYGWPVVDAGGSTFAYESGRSIVWYEGSSFIDEAILRDLGLD